MTCSEALLLLNPYLDSELDLTSALSVESHLAECPICEKQYRRLVTLHHEIANAELEFVPGPELEKQLARFRTKAEPSRWSTAWHRAPWLVAAAAVLVLLIAVPFRTVRDDFALDREVLDNHLRSLAGAHLVDVPSSDHHTVKPWFQGKTEFSPNVPELSQNGFTLVGGRVDVLRQQRVATLIYKRREHLINLFIAREGSDGDQVQSRDASGYHLLRWTQNGMRYWAVSDLNSAELLQFAELVRSSLRGAK